MTMKSIHKLLKIFNRKRKSIKEDNINSKMSLKAKLMLSHILIAIVPILIIVIALTTQASNSLIQKVNSSNLAYVSKVTKIFNGNIKSIEDITRIILSDVDLNSTISKDENSYDNTSAMLQDRKANYDNKIQALQFSNTSIKSIFLIKET
ncbi:MAG: uncharacterized protein K0R31_950, partial [Clostridiales bacterium]|nr:uncharacterized protein [Clostridiales bacterium]